MKTNLKISTFAVISVLCATMTATAASSVRTLGGAGTYESASSAAAANDSAVRPATRTAARSGSVRVNPTTAGSNRPTASGTASADRSSTTSRLSIGKYLGGGSSVTGNTYVRPQGGSSDSGSMAPGSATADAIKTLEEAIAKKQDKLTDANAGQYIKIVDGGEISVDYANLQQKLATDLGVDAAVVDIQFANGVLQYKLMGSNTWQDITTADAIIAAGNAATKGEVYTKAQTYTKDEVNTLISGVDLSGLTTAEQLTEALKAYATTAAMNTAIDTAVAGLATKEELKDYVTKTGLATTLDEFPDNKELSDALALKADKTAVDALQTELDNLEVATGNVGTLTSDVAALQTKVGTGTLPTEEGFGDITAAINTLVESDTEFMIEANKRFEETDAVVDANTAAIATNATEIAKKAASSDVTALAAKVGSAELPSEEGFEDLVSAVNTLATNDMDFMVAANARFEETDAVVDANTAAIAKNAADIAKKADLTTVESTYATKQALADEVTARESGDETLAETVAQHTTKIGLAVLGTEAKDLSGAINELVEKTTGIASSANLEALAGRVGTLETAVAGKADSADVTANASAIEALQTTVAGKADSADVTANASAIEALQTTVAGKADTTAVNEALADKAAQSDLDALAAVVGDAESGMVKSMTELAGAVATNANSISTITNETTGILAQAKAYADSLDVTDEVAQLNQDVAGLVAEDTVINGKITALETAIGDAESGLTQQAAQAALDAADAKEAAEDAVAAAAAATTKAELAAGNVETAVSKSNEAMTKAEAAATNAQTALDTAGEAAADAASALEKATAAAAAVDGKLDATTAATTYATIEALTAEATARGDADEDLQSQIDALEIPAGVTMTTLAENVTKVQNDVTEVKADLTEVEQNITTINNTAAFKGQITGDDIKNGTLTAADLDIAYEPDFDTTMPYMLMVVGNEVQAVSIVE